jgi:hypothetical protein
MEQKLFKTGRAVLVIGLLAVMAAAANSIYTTSGDINLDPASNTVNNHGNVVVNKNGAAGADGKLNLMSGDIENIQSDFFLNFQRYNTTSGAEVDTFSLYMDNTGDPGFIPSIKLRSYDNTGSILENIIEFSRDGDVHVDGELTAGTKTFLIDNPEDPLNSILSHISSESPEALIEYRGRGDIQKIIRYDNGNGWEYIATPLSNTSVAIELPSWFNDLAIGETSKENDFTVQVTGVNGFCGDAYARFNQLENNILTIHTEKPCKFSWELQAVRQDPYYVENPVYVVENKNASDEDEKKGSLKHRSKYVQYCGKHPNASFCSRIPAKPTTTQT